MTESVPGIQSAPPTASVAAVIPAAGLSHRMGLSKALLDAGGQSFLARILSSLREGGAEPLLVVVRDDTDPVAREAEGNGGKVILNPDPSPGPVSSLQAGIRSLPDRAAGVLFAPVDHPLFLPTTVRTLIQAFIDTGAPLLAPTFAERRGHPVLFGRTLFPELLEKDLPQGARTVVRRYLHAREEVPVVDPGILADIDTPEEYRAHFS
jgi:molybdenum cofactor cytidylyltransferase